MKARFGFTLVEMIVAVALSSIVMVGLIDITASMLERHFEGIRHGAVDSETLYSLDQMRLELEAATYYSNPSTSSSASMSIQGCGNYSMQPITLPNGTQTNQIYGAQPISSFAYCVQNLCASGAVPCDPSGYTGPYDLVRYASSGSCMSISCGGGGGQTLVYQNVYLEPSFSNPFYLNSQFGGVDMHLIVGYPVATAVEQTPTYYQIDTTFVPDTGRLQ